MLATIGDGGYSDGIRAWMIRDRLTAFDTADERALFDVQLDNRSVFLDRWRAVFLRGDRRPTPPPPPRGPRRARLVRDVVDRAHRARFGRLTASFAPSA